MTTYYVDKNGSDSGSGTQNSPFFTITKAISRATFPDDTVHINDGIFDENVSNFVSGTSGHPIVIEGNGDTTIWRHSVNANGTIGGYSDACAYIINRRCLTFRNIKFDGCGALATIYTLASIGTGVGEITITGCTFSNNGNNGQVDGFTTNSKVIYLTGINNIPNGPYTVTNNSFTTNKGYCIHLLQANVSGTLINNNDITNMLNSPGAGLEGIHFGSGSSFLTITSNKIHDSALGGGIKGDAGVTNSIIKFNIIQNLTGSSVIGIENESGCNNNTIQYNIITNIRNGNSNGIRIGSYSTGTATGNVVDGNSIVNCASGIVLGQSINGFIRNNLISLGTGTTYNCIFTSDISTGNIFKNNIYYRNGQTNIAFRNAPDANSLAHPANLSLASWSSATGDANSINADPLIISSTVGSENVHLQSASPALRSGDSGQSIGAYPNETFSEYHVAKNGSDTLGNGTSANPYLTIQKAITSVGGSGVIITVHGGNYSEVVSSWISGSPNNPLIVRANPGETVNWNSGSTDETGSNTCCIVFTNKRYITIEGFNFANSVNRHAIRILGPTLSGIENKDPAAQVNNLVIGITIQGNTFTTCGNDSLDSSGQATGSLSSIIEFNATGMPSTYTGSPLNFIRNNYFNHCYGFAITMTVGATDTDISYNIIKNLHSSSSSGNAYGFLARGIHLGGSSGNNPGGRCFVHHNVISDFIMDAYSAANTTLKADGSGGTAPAFVGCGIRLDVFQSGSVIEDNIIHHIKYNDIRLNASPCAGIEPESACSNNIFRRNIIYRINGHGIEDGTQSTNTASNNQYLNNVIFQVTKHGIFLNNSKNTKVKNNIIHVLNGTACINVQGLSVTQGGLVFEKNCYYRSGQTLINTWNGAPNFNSNSDYPADKTIDQWITSSGEVGAINVDPLFFDVSDFNFDFNLLESSPCKFLGFDGNDIGYNPQANQKFFRNLNITAPFSNSPKVLSST